MLDLVWLIPALPLAGFLVLLAVGSRLREPLSGWVATVAMGGSFVAAVLVYLGLLDREAEARSFRQTLFEWIPLGDLQVDMAFLADPLSLTFALFVTGVGALIHLYSIGYMHGDPRYARFFTYLNLFAFFMLMLVLGDNLLVTFLGWEGVGLCSYLLISFWFTDEANAVAGKKAFITNRVGDVGFLIAMFLTFTAVGSLDYADLLREAEGLAAATASGIALLLFLGAVGKSAQLPLYVWLPDAMAGPTPVSALIHAATMVTAGVYLMIRVNPVLAAAHGWVPDTIAWIGAATALFAATIAVAQTDIKRVLAYSTISQLGYAFLAVGVGGYVAALFHVVTHAFFKAVLFLGAGSVIHGLHDEQDMRRMGGLRALMPITALTFMAGWLAIAGVPPFAGFWSKDDILLFAWNESPALWAVGLVTALLTAFYMSRQVFLVFFGEPRWREGEGEPHDPPFTMRLPLMILGGLAVVAGVINLPFSHDTEFLHRWLEPVVHAGETELSVGTGGKWALAALAVLAGLGGIAAAVAVYLRHRVEARRVEPDGARRGWYVDETLAGVVDGPGRRTFDLTAAFDRVVIDGAVNGVAAAVRGTATQVRRLQSGYVRNYALGVALGAVVLIALVFTRASF